MERIVSDSDVFNDAARLKAVEALRQQLGLPEVSPGMSEASPETTAASSIGIEIEINWRQAFPEIAEQWPNPGELHSWSREYRAFSAAYNARNKAVMPILEGTRAIIPRVGSDGYWEFSFLPTRNVAVTIAELSALYESGILRDGEEYALHMTVAGISNDRDAFAFLCDLELSGGTTSTRIMQAGQSKKGAWARKGDGGILLRQPTELLGDDETGYELRTLVAQSKADVASTLQRAAQLTHYLQDPENWCTHRKEVELRLAAHDLELKPWDKPRVNPLPWMRYIQLLESTVQ